MADVGSQLGPVRIANTRCINYKGQLIYNVTKVCTLCKARKKITSFSPHKRGKFGVTSWCRRCADKRSMEWASKNRNKVNANDRRYRRTPYYKYMLLKHRARHRGLEFNLDEKYFAKIIAQTICVYCSKDLTKLPRRSRTIDRKDNTKGYIKGNVVRSCKSCNSRKSNKLSFDEMKRIGAL